MASAAARIRVWPGVAALLMSAAPPEEQAAPPALFDAQGYRSASYRAPVDRDPLPARRITVAAARKLRPGSDALFIDVLAAEGARRDPVTGRWALVTAHESIPGALWFPEVGRSSPDPVLWDAMADRVMGFRKSHPSAPIVLFCRADCWMSWNAARQLARSYPPPIFWLAEGIEGWREAGGRLSKAAPEQASGPTNHQEATTKRRVTWRH